jgi:hypothetical protein
VLKALLLQSRKGLFYLGTVGGQPALAMVKDNLRNVPAVGSVLGPWATPQPGLCYPETFYFSSGAKAPPTPLGLK